VNSVKCERPKCKIAACADWNEHQLCALHFAEAIYIHIENDMTPALSEHLKRLTNRFAEATGHDFTKIPNARLVLEKEIASLENELKSLSEKGEADKMLKSQISALLVSRKRELASLVR
jgi:hypothetical protein